MKIRDPNRINLLKEIPRIFRRNAYHGNSKDAHSMKCMPRTLFMKREKVMLEYSCAFGYEPHNSVEKYQHFREIHFLNIQGESFTLKMEASVFSETVFPIYKFTCHSIPKDSNIRSHRGKNFYFYRV
jgi:hypothetical protein